MTHPRRPDVIRGHPDFDRCVRSSGSEWEWECGEDGTPYLKSRRKEKKKLPVLGGGISGFSKWTEDGGRGNQVTDVNWAGTTCWKEGERVEDKRTRGREEEENAVLLLLSSLCRDAACSVHPTSGGEGAFQHNGSGFSLLWHCFAPVVQAISSPRQRSIVSSDAANKSISSLGRCLWLWLAARTRKPSLIRQSEATKNADVESHDTSTALDVPGCRETGLTFPLPSPHHFLAGLRTLSEWVPNSQGDNEKR